ncbi:MAG: ribose-5-phosphate isomerase RpiA [Thermoplasmata archaeon]|jgi:ribose 5-phosphate isomerase A|nr:MAG: ribose-5-phosphate isomerase RpiA [Thermoplasmata archaeon]
MEELKRMAAVHAASYIEDGMIVGLGTGSTAKYAVEKIGEMVREGMEVVGIATSKETEQIARDAGIPLSELNEHDIDITIDGADQVDGNLNLIKGGGGALLREKMVASCSKKEIIVVDESKVVDSFSFPLPVEVVKFGWESVAKKLRAFGFTPKLREGFVTDNGNYILDCRYSNIEDAEEMETMLNTIPGVVENGLFVGLADVVVVGTKRGIRILGSI